MIISTLTLDDHLAKIYAADIKGQKAYALADFEDALKGDAELMTSARARFVSLTAMIAARGAGACAYSAKYQEYLAEALS